MAHISIEECRSILGAEADGHSDEQIGRLRDSLESAATVMYDEIVKHAQIDPESVRWYAYAFENPETANGEDIPDEAFPYDGPNLLDFPEEQ